MKKILMVLYAFAIVWLWVGVSVCIYSFNDSIQNANTIGVLFGDFLAVSTPIGLVITYHRYLNKKQKESRHALQ